MAQAAGALEERSSPSPFDERELLQLLETFSADDIADVVSSVDVDAVRSADVVHCVDDGDALHSTSLGSSSGGSGDDQQQVVRKRRVRPPQTSATRRSDPNKARNERKQELLYLHKKVDELEAQLRALRERTAITDSDNMRRQQQLVLTGSSSHDHCSSSNDNSDSAGGAQLALRTHSLAHRRLQNQSSSSSNTAAARVWHELIERQRTLRARSEKENIRLRLVLETQLKLARSLEKLLLRPGAAKELERCLTLQQQQQQHHHHHHYSSSGAPQLTVQIAGSPTLGPSTTAPFDALLAGAARAYAEIDAVFAVNGLAHCGTQPYRDARVQRDPRTGRVYMELVASKTLPFALEATRDAVWHHFVFGKETIPHRYHTDHAPKVFLPTMTSYLKSFGLEVHANHKSASFQIKQVIQQHAERGRVVIIWQAAIDPVAFSEAPLPRDVGIIETGYVVVQCLPSDTIATATAADSMGIMDDDNGSNLTLLQTCHVITPAASDVSGGGTSGGEGGDSAFFRVGALTDFVLSATAANVTTSYDTIEDTLLEQAMRRQRSES